MQAKIPDNVAGMHPRKLGDGSFWLPRINAQAKSILEKDFIYIKGTHRWVPRTVIKNDVSQLKEHFYQKACYIVGKGLSLDNLSPENFPDWSPIICINESIHKVCSLGLRNPIFGIQQDNRLKDTCFNKGATMIISRQARIHYPEDEVYSFIPENYNSTTGTITVVVAIEILKTFDVTNLTLLCFDGCMNNVFTYGTCIGYPVTGDPSRFRIHRKIIDSHASDIQIKWVIPEDPQRSSSDRQQPSQDNQPVNRDPDPTLFSIENIGTQDSPSETEHSQRASLPDHSEKEPSS